MKPTTYYYISTGDKSGFYTLRVVTFEYSEERYMNREQYVQNLSTDWNEAVKKAVKMTGGRVKGTDRPFPLTPFGRDQAAWQTSLDMYTRISVMPAGKHIGKTIEEVIAEDEQYVNWLANWLWDGPDTRTFGKLSRSYSILFRVQLMLDLGDKFVPFEEQRLNNQAERAALEEKWAEEKAAAKPVPNGRLQVSGVVLKTEWRENEFNGHCVGRYVGTVKTDDGYVLWGTMSKDAKRNDRVTFTATLEQSDRDPKFGFYKRPTKWIITSHEENDNG